MSAEDRFGNTLALSTGGDFTAVHSRSIRITTRKRTKGRRCIATRQRAGYAEAIVGRAVTLDIDVLAVNLPREASEQD